MKTSAARECFLSRELLRAHYHLIWSSEFAGTTATRAGSARSADQSRRGGSPPAGYRGTLIDVTDQRQQEARNKITICEKETLLKEVHHRVKNNMQIISSMLHLQESSVKDPFDQVLFQESQNRIRTMALVHEQLYHSQNLAAIDFGEYLQKLAVTMKSAYMGEDIRCALDSVLGACPR